MEDVEVHVTMFIDVINKQMENLNKSLKSLDRFIRKNTISNKKFITTMLSTMFAAQKLNQVFSGMLFPAMQMVGIFDIINATLGVVFLPIALAMMNALIPIMTWFMDLPPSAQLVIGAFTALGAAITGLAAAILPLYLAFTQITGLTGMAGLSTLAGGLASAMDALLGPIGLIILAAVAVWSTNFGGFRDFVDKELGIILALFKSIWKLVSDVVTGAWETINGILTGDTEKTNDGLKKIFKALADFLLDLFAIIGIALVDAFIFAANAIKDVFTKVIFGQLTVQIKALADLLSNLPGEWGATFKNISQGIDAMNTKVASFVPNLPYADISTAIASLDPLKKKLDELLPTTNTTTAPTNTSPGMSYLPGTGQDKYGNFQSQQAVTVNVYPALDAKSIYRVGTNTT
jgi:hypothetical protein